MGYYYRDQQGNEKGPFDYASMQSWFSAGYFKSDMKVCKGLGGKMREIAVMLVQDARENGVADDMIGFVVQPKYGLGEHPSTKNRFGSSHGIGASSSTGYNDGGYGKDGSGGTNNAKGGTEFSRTTQLSEENVHECVDKVVETLTEILPIVLEGGLRAEFGDMWADMTTNQPPWNFEQAARELKSNWSSLFTQSPRRNHEFEVLMYCLYRKRKDGVYCGHVGEARALAEAAVKLIEGCPKDFPEVVNAKLAQGWEAIEQVREILKR